MKTALTIAGSDPTGGAGLQADMKVFGAFGVHGMSVPSALTAQNTCGVSDIFPVDESVFHRQLDVLLRDIRPDAIKTGMLYKRASVEIVASFVTRLHLLNLVIDPVTVSSSGVSLVEEGTLDAIKSVLFPLAKVITPNIYEASVLTGIGIEDQADMERAAIRLKEFGPEVVVVTGGHLEGIAMDLFYDGSAMHWVDDKKIEGEFHGTGCAFSAALAANLALGHSPLECVRLAKEFMRNAIRKAFHPGSGMGILNL